MYYFSYAYLPIFLGLTVLFYFVTPIKKRWIILLAASLIFYIYYAKLLSVFIFITAITIYLTSIWLQKINALVPLTKGHLSKDEKATFKGYVLWQKKAVIVLLILVNFGILAGLKYYGFAAENLNAALGFVPIHMRLPSMSMILPLGISFYTLQAVGYVVDVYRGKVEANRNLGQVLLFLCFFPQIVEGPIGRYDHLAPQLYQGHRFDYRGFTQGMQLILWGLLKKMVIADRASLLANKVFDHSGSYSGAAVALAILLYTLQLYADFSGCIDVARGSAQMLGIHLASNFERPFLARSVNEFWRRWHITLGAWLRDYIFYPVSLSKPLVRFNQFIRRSHNTHLGRWVSACSALFFVWLGNGIWHGAGWKYLAYGMYYYILMMLGMLFEPAIRKVLAGIHVSRENIPYRVFQILRTFILVNIGMLIFRSENLQAAFTMFLSMFKGFSVLAIFNGPLLRHGLGMNDLMVLVAAVVVLVVVGMFKEKGIGLRVRIGSWPLPARWAIYLAGIFTLVIFGAYGTGYNPTNLIYASF